MKKTGIVSAVMVYLLLVSLPILAAGCWTDPALFTVADQPWPESLGNHRAVIEVDGHHEAVRLVLPWRRHDPDPGERMLVLVHEASHDTVPNIHRVRVDNEVCEIIAPDGQIRGPTMWPSSIARLMPNTGPPMSRAPVKPRISMSLAAAPPRTIA